MALREFTDDRGERWRVWEVHPRLLERRHADDPSKRPAVERRRTPQLRVKPSDPAMTEGWLTFDSRGERRRICPIPAGWEHSDDAELRRLLARAIPVGRTGRLVE